MAVSTQSKRISLFLHLAAGGALILTAILADAILQKPPEWGRLHFMVLGAGLLLLFIGCLPEIPFIFRLSTNLSLSVLFLFVSVIICEGFFRAIGFDFAQEKRAWLKMPPYYRQPIVPTGEAFFRRPGPEQWTGQVLSTVMKSRNASLNPYINEPVVTIAYNKWGFRNPDPMQDWEIAVAGDSYTELGYLPYEELFTTILGQILNARVLNLGTSYTGPLTQLSYLQEYGLSKSTKDVVIVFFEGNDLDDLDDEYKNLDNWKRTGQRRYREFKTDASLIRAIYRYLRGFERSLQKSDSVEGYFKSPDGLIPISVAYAPPGSAELSPASVAELKYFFRQYAAFGQAKGVRVWLAYMPCIFRVLHGHIQFRPGINPKKVNWQPTDLPQLISRLAASHGVHFIDLTSALRKENESHLVFNPVYDTHLNRLGSLAVARELAREFKNQGLNSGHPLVRVL
jgi:hypothetical protein